MTRVLLAIFLILTATAAFAAEGARTPLYMRAPIPPLQNPKAQAIAASRECWRACQRQCAAQLFACGYQLPGGECLAATDSCDRSCQRQCRSTGDPLLDIFN